METLETPATPDLFFSLASDRSTVEVTGSDRLSWLNGLVTCNLAPLKPGQGAYGLATSKVGKILADLDIVIQPERILLSCPSSRIGALLENFDRYIVMEDVELRDASGEHAWFLLHGARAQTAATAFAAELDGVAAALDRTGLHDAVLVVPAARQEATLEAIRRAAAPLSEHDWLRIQHGAPLFGTDFDESHYPQEASLEKRAVSFCKGCYLGQEVICRLEMRGHVHRRLAILQLEGNEPAARGTPVQAAGADVGHLTSASWSPDLGKTLALAMLKFASSEPGTSLEVSGRSATVISVGAPS